MPLLNVFENDWRECLKAHYQHVVEEQDADNERSLITVLHDSGFEDDEIQAMRRDIVGLHEVISEESIVQADAAVKAEPEQPDRAEAAEIQEATTESMPGIDTMIMTEASVTPDVSTMQTEEILSAKRTPSKKPKQLSLF